MCRTFFFHIEDDDADAFLMEQALHRAFGRLNAVVMRAATLAEAEVFLARSPVDVLLLDLRVPDVRSLDEGIVRVRQHSDAPIVVVSNNTDGVITSSVAREQIELHIMKQELEDPHHVVRCLGPLIADLTMASRKSA